MTIEYKVIQAIDFSPVKSEEFVEDLNALGNRGWEMCGTRVTDGYTSHYLFKRERWDGRQNTYRSTSDYVK